MSLSTYRVASAVPGPGLVGGQHARPGPSLLGPAFQWDNNGAPKHILRRAEETKYVVTDVSKKEANIIPATVKELLLTKRKPLSFLRIQILNESH